MFSKLMPFTSRIISPGSIRPSRATAPLHNVKDRDLRQQKHGSRPIRGPATIGKPSLWKTLPVECPPNGKPSLWNALLMECLSYGMPPWIAQTGNKSYIHNSEKKKLANKY